MTRQSNRREFLKHTALTGVGVWVAGTSFAQESTSANGQINFACVGVGGKGSSDSADAGRHGKVVAICDVDGRTLQKAAGAFKEAKKYFDFRTMYDEMGDKIDAVTVSTPDHCHAVAAVMGIKMGKHCFTQKPMTHSIYEARVMGELARETKLATQMGNQGTASSGLRKAAAEIRAGALGRVTEVHVWTNRPIWPQGIERPSDTPPVPAHVHWQQWLGPAPYRAYHPSYHPFKWRGWWDFGTGALGDMACHTVNLPYMALDLREPISVEAESPGHNRETYPARSVIRFEFPEYKGRPALRMTWYDGGKRPPQELLEGEKAAGSGCLIIGEKGKYYAPGDMGDRGVYLPKGTIQPPQVEYPKSPGHFAEWVRAIKGGEPAISNFPDYAGPLTETILLGNLAIWSGKKVEWDAQDLKATNAPELARIVNRKYCEGYSL